MSRTKTPVDAPSLLNHFDPPEGYVGHFGWLCGYSADVDFLEMAAERFTGYIRPIRAHAGRMALAVMLDPGNPEITPVDVPAVCSLRMRMQDTAPFKLLHAKLGLLGFRDPADPRRWSIRLLVSTGNWTRQTLEESLDLVWRVDVDSDALEAPDAQTRRDCADVRAAHDLMIWLRGLFDTRLLTQDSGVAKSDTALAFHALEEWLEAAGKRGRGHARFVDNRKRSMLAQLPEMISHAGSDSACNYLAMGSGFYESSDRADRVPQVLTRIVTRLRDKGHITKNGEIDVFVNPYGCQSVAKCLVPMMAVGFTVRPAQTPVAVFGHGPERTLHAKFLFAANYRKDSNHCSSAWLYLGSANLTTPGFLHSAQAGGNLEAGVIFCPPDLKWRDDKDVKNLGEVASNCLPILQLEPYVSPAQLEAGEGMPERDAQLHAGPVAWLRWIDGTDDAAAGSEGGYLMLPEPLPQTTQLEVIDAGGAPCAAVENGYVWASARPRQVLARWCEGEGGWCEGRLPVVDVFGRIACAAPAALEIDEAVGQLLQFPAMSGDEEDLEDDTDPGAQEDGVASPTGAVASRLGGGHAIRQMMTLIEQVAARQLTIAQSDWPSWCNRLEQTLMLAAGSQVVSQFRGLKIDPLIPLFDVPFRPPYVLPGSAEEQRYDALLQQVRQAWGVSSFNPIGDVYEQ